MKKNTNSWVCFGFLFHIVLIILLHLLPGSTTAQLTSSESSILLELQQYLEYPDALKNWNKWTNFCFLPASSNVVVVCSSNYVTQLTIIGNKTTASRQTLSSKFNIDSFFTALTKLSGLQKLSLISLGIWGPLPSKISRLSSSLQVLNISSNSISGPLPESISSLENLQSLNLSNNFINGSTVPDLSGLQKLEELDLGNNQIGPKFPSLGRNLVAIVLKKNSLRSEFPSYFKDFNNLQRLDISSNHMVGPIPSFLLGLPVLWYINLANNQFTGAFSKKTSCGGKVWYVDVSRNLLTGELPACIGSKKDKRVVYSTWNCLSGGGGSSQEYDHQHKVSFCQRQALAVIPPGGGGGGGGKDDKRGEEEEKSKVGVVKMGVLIGVVAGIIVVIAAIGLVTVCICRIIRKKKESGENDKLIIGFAPRKNHPTTTSRATKAVAQAKHLPMSMRRPSLGLSAYNVFSIEELEAATNNFDPHNLVERDKSHDGQKVYKGCLPSSGAAILVKCIKLKQKHSSKMLKQHMEVISQLRHQNLVSVLGHCIVFYNDRANKGTTLFIALENVSNGSLRDHLTDWRRRDVLKWPQRMTISMGIARGMHFLHTGMAPGIFGNDLRIQKILLDESLTPKISAYRIPLPPKEEQDAASSRNNGGAEKDDVYQFGVILLEILTGKEVTSGNQLVEELKLELERSLAGSPSALHQAVDRNLRGTFAYQSLKTAVELAINCLCKEPSRRPSIEDVQWNMQYSIQVQQAWTTSGNLGLYSGNLGLTGNNIALHQK